MAIRILSTESVDGGITGNNLRTNTGNLFVGNGSNTTANIYGFGDSLMIQGVSGATYLRVSGTATLAGTLQAGQFILATGLAYGAVNNYTQIIDGSTGAITGTSATFSGDVTLSKTGSTGLIIRTTDNTEPYFALQRNSGSNGVGVLRLLDGGDLTFDTGATGAGQTTRLTIDGSNGIATFTATTKSTRFTSTTTSGLHWSNYTGSNGWQIGADSTAAGMYIYNENGVYTLKLTDAGNATFAGTVTATQFIGDVDITGGIARFDSTTAGVTVVDSQGAYASSGSVKLYQAKRSGGAVAGDWSYDDATTDMSLGTNTNHNFSIKTNNSRVINVTNTGRVGIGVSPSYKLQVLETGGASTNIGIYTNVQGTGANNYAFYADATQGTSNNFAFYAASGESAFLGATGVGTNNPEKKLHVKGTTSDDTPQVLIQNSSTGDASLTFNVSGQSYVTGIDQDDSSKFKIAASGNLGTNDRITLLSDGKVGIGTITPTKQLHIVNTSGDVRGLMVETTVAASYAEVQVKAASEYRIGTGGSSTVPNGEFYVYDATAGAHRFDIDSAGNVRIGGNTSINGAFGASNTVVSIKGRTSGGEGILQLTGLGNNATDIVSRIEFHSQAEADPMCSIRAVRGNADDVGSLSFLTNNGGSPNTNMVLKNDGKVGIGENDPSYELEIGGTANPKIAITSNINSATSSLYFGDSDAKDRGQIVYTHFGDFMELKTGGNTRVYLESGINTAYTADGLYNGNATPSYWTHGNAQFKLGYMDNGSGLYSGAYSFNVKSTDGIPVTGREIGAIYVRDTSNNRMPLIISNQGRININQTNTSTGLASTGWIDIQNGTSAYNFFNYYTGTDGTSGCARYRVDNTSPSFFDFYYSTTQVGYITTNGTDIFYANTSDYRLKEDLKDFNGISLLEQIQVYDFKWKESENRMYGVVAHELQEIVPQAVVGNKDEDKLQAVDYSKLVPILIKSIQELEARVKELENK